MFTHVLDLGTEHEPCCHFVMSSPSITDSFSKLIPLPGCPSEIFDLSSFDVFKIEISKKDLLNAYLNRHLSIQNKLSILHYVLVHINDMDMVQEVSSVHLATYRFNVSLTKTLFS